MVLTVYEYFFFTVLLNPYILFGISMALIAIFVVKLKNKAFLRNKAKYFIGNFMDSKRVIEKHKFSNAEIK